MSLLPPPGVERDRHPGKFPGLRAADLVNAWAYAEANHQEIVRAIRENENA